MKATTCFVFLMTTTSLVACDFGGIAGRESASAGHASNPARPRLQPVRVVEARWGSVADARTYLAETVPRYSVKIVARVPGTVSTLGAPEGVAILQGEPIARISAPDVAARLSRVRAERRRAERERDFACRMLETDRRLARSNDLSRTQLERSEKACASATLALEAAKAAEAEAEVTGTRAVERAPFDGEVLAYQVDPGQSVMPGMAIAIYGSTEKELRVRLVDRDVRRIRPGIVVELDEGKGRVVRVAPQPRGPARLYDVWISIPEARSSLRIGETQRVRVVFQTSEETTLVPGDAIFDGPEGPRILVAEAGRLRAVDLTPGLSEAGWVAIRPPLSKGTWVVTSRPERLDLSAPVLAVRAP